MNTTAAKASKADALIEELEKLEDSERLDDLAIRRLSREAHALMPSHAAGAHLVLGGIAGIEGDATKVREHYRIALQLSQRELTVLSNYATALGRAGEFDEGFAATMEAHQRAPDDMTLLSNAIHIAVQGGRFRESLTLCDTWKKLQPDHPFRQEPAVRKAADATRRGLFTEEAVRKVLRIAHEVRVASKVLYAGCAMQEVFGEPDRFSFTVYVRSTPRRAIELEGEFVERVVANAPLMADPGLMFVLMFKGTTVNGGDSRTAA